MPILIASIAIVPFLLAWFYARNPNLVTKRSNYGTLIIPAQPLSYDDLLVPADAGRNPLQQAKGRWIMLQALAAGTECGTVCRDTLLASRQIRLLLNKDMARVRRLLLADAASALPDDALGDSDLLVGKATAAVTEALARALGRAPEEGMLILIDPFANAMMWYPPRFDPYGVLRDLKHLLRSSQIG